MPFVREQSGGTTATLIGTYTANATIDVSQYSASSADEFLAVPQTQGFQSVAQYYQNTNQGYQKFWLSFTAPSVTLSNNTLSLSVGSYAFRGTDSGGGTVYGSGACGNTVKLYYVGKIG